MEEPRVWANEWDVLHCTPSRGGRGRRAAVHIFRGVFFYCLMGFRFFFFRFLYFERTRPTAQVRGNLASGRVLTSSKPLGTLGME